MYVGQTCQRLAKLAYPSLFYRFYSVPAITKILKTHIPNSQQPSVCFFLLIALICFCCLILFLCSWTAGIVSLSLTSFHIFLLLHCQLGKLILHAWRDTHKISRLLVPFRSGNSRIWVAPLSELQLKRNNIVSEPPTSLPVLLFHTCVDAIFVYQLISFIRLLLQNQQRPFWLSHWTS